jgi:hypothetical protein
VFVYLCETFLWIPPSITLFLYFFKLKPHPSATKPNVLGGAGIQFRLRKKQEYFDYTLVDSMKDWKVEWFYAKNVLPALAVHTNAGPSVNSR